MKRKKSLPLKLILKTMVDFLKHKQRDICSTNQTYMIPIPFPIYSKRSSYPVFHMGTPTTYQNEVKSSSFFRTAV